MFSGSNRQGEVHLGVLQQWFGVHWWNSREFALLVILLLVLLPLVLYRRVGKLLLHFSLFHCGYDALICIMNLLAHLYILEQNLNTVV